VTKEPNVKVDSRGYSIHYEVYGSGPPLVMIPGLLMSSDRWHEVGYVSALEPQFRVVTLDPLGHGASSKPHEAEPYGLEDCAQDVIAVLDQEGIEQAHTWGYSRGGGIAGMLATRFPARLLTLIVGGYVLSNLPVIPAMVQWREKQIGALREGDWNSFWRMFGLEDALLQSLLAKRNDPLAVAAVMEADLRRHSQLDLSKCEAPIMIYAGSEESAFALMQTAADAIGATFHAIDGAGHAKAFQELDTVLPVVREHLQACG